MTAFWTAFLSAVAAVFPTVAELLGHRPAPEPAPAVKPGFGAQEQAARAEAAKRAEAGR
jgi:hypothetical protein